MIKENNHCLNYSPGDCYNCKGCPHLRAYWRHDENSPEEAPRIFHHLCVVDVDENKIGSPNEAIANSAIEID